MGLVSRTLPLLFSFFLLVGFGVVSYANAADVEVIVKLDTRAFTPNKVKIKVGDRVTWSNRSKEEHFLTSTGAVSGPGAQGIEDLMIHKLLHPEESYSFAFEEPETYFYFCAIHMDMGGTIIVE